MLTWFFDLLFPPRCLNCQESVKSGEVLCDLCFSNIKISKTLFCGKCRARIAPPVHGLAGRAEYKKICHQDFPYLLGAAADYQDETTKQLIRNLKFKFVQAAARPLASLLVNYVESINPPHNGVMWGINYPIAGFVVVPIPLSKTRERQRGFNQSFLIAETFADRLGLELNPNILIRNKHTEAQSEIKDFEKKRENVKNCFSVNPPHNGVMWGVKGKNFILIDDVVTSGATFFEAASALKRSGAKKIIALAAAKS